MGYEIPKEKEVEEIILKILRRRGIVESQAELNREVLKHLKRKNKDYKLSGRRMRIIAIKSGKVRIEIKYKIGDRKIEIIEKCPVCGSQMVKITNLTLEGEKVTIGFKCVNCPYWTGKQLRIPIRYIFRYNP